MVELEEELDPSGLCIRREGVCSYVSPAVADRATCQYPVRVTVVHGSESSEAERLPRADLEEFVHGAMKIEVVTPFSMVSEHGLDLTDFFDRRKPWLAWHSPLRAGNEA